MDADYSLEHGQNDEWVMVNTNDGSRSPQYNGDNEASGHKANASTSLCRHDSSFEEIEAFGQDLPPAVTRQTISNGYSETMTSVTATGDPIAAPHVQYAPSRGTLGAEWALTQSNLERQEHLDAVNVPGWILNSGVGSRLTLDQADPSAHGSMSVGRSVPSATGSVAHERTSSSQSSVSFKDIGAWADDPIEALLKSTSNLGLNSK